MDMWWGAPLSNNCVVVVAGLIAYSGGDNKVIVTKSPPCGSRLQPCCSNFLVHWALVRCLKLMMKMRAKEEVSKLCQLLFVAGRPCDTRDMVRVFWYRIQRRNSGSNTDEDFPENQTEAEKP
jgi:hypothetical protein